MQAIRTIKDIETAMRPYIPLVAQLTGKDTTLERIRPLMALAGNPQDELRLIHLAGTSGKTSTAYYTAALIQAAGKKVGLTVSPHVDSITERVQMNGKPLTPEKFGELLGEFLKLVRQLEQAPSYFELLYAFALWVFAREGVDYAVVETGLGGLYDATNIANRADKICIITDIGFDHMHILGNTLPEIAAQKIGIVHPGNEVLMYRQVPEIMEVVEQWVHRHRAHLTITSEQAEQEFWHRGFGDLPAYQQHNWLLAWRAYRLVAERDNLPGLDHAQLARTQQIVVPGRMEERQIHGKTIVLDGAHNPQKIATFINSFQKRYPGGRPAVLLALKQGKGEASIAPLIAGFARRTIVTTFSTSQDFPPQPVEAEELAAELKNAGAIDVISVPNHHEAFQQLLQSEEQLCVIIGSFYLLSQLRQEEGVL